jgi:ABC-type lipoprotein export system ATPase subunit
LADEPTGNLDSKTGGVIYELLTEIAGERTVLVVTHAEPLAQRADRVLHIKDGRLGGAERPARAETGRPERPLTEDNR